MIFGNKIQVAEHVLRALSALSRPAAPRRVNPAPRPVFGQRGGGGGSRGDGCNCSGKRR